MQCDFVVNGMSCAACVARVEKAARSVEGVTDVTVNLLTGDMRVEGSFDPQSVAGKVTGAGYETAVKPSIAAADEKAKEKREDDIKKRLIRLIVSAVLLAAVFTVSMIYMHGGGMEDMPVKQTAAVFGTVEAVIALAVIAVNFRIFTSGFKSLFRLSPNMDSLIATGVTASYGYSLAVLISVIASDNLTAMPDYYFESSAMILTFMGLGKLLEAIAKGRATDAVAALKDLIPDTCTVIRGGSELTVKTGDVKVGETLIIKPGDRVALDCDIVSGISEIDESPVTGESIPVLKKTGDKAVCGTLNVTGVITGTVTSAAGDTTVDRMAERVREIAATKAPIARTADKVAGIFVPFVMGISLIVLIAWTVAGKEIGYSLSRAVSVLVVSCPCALGLATPVAILCGSACAAKRGVLFKSSEALETCGKVKTVVFDKTGTLTEGNMNVYKVFPAEDIGEETLLKKAAECEYGGTHPIAEAIVKHAREAFNFEPSGGPDMIREFIPGQGASFSKSGEKILCGKKDFVGTNVPEIPDVDSGEGYAGSAVYVSLDGNYAGCILISDTVAEKAAECIEVLNKRGIGTVMLTGDNERAARSMAEKLGIKEFRAGLLPQQKSDEIGKIRASSKGFAAMVGDGINDAPALTAADVGIAVGRGTDIAIESAGVVITGRTLTQVSGTVLLAKRTLLVIYENLFWAFGYNIIGIPLAAGLFSLLNESFVLDPSFSALAMSVSSVLVVTNALRLLAMGNSCFGKLDKNEITKPIDNGEKKMVKTVIEVNGMMCGHCEMHVNNAISSNFKVISVVSDRTKNETVIISEEEPDISKLAKVIADEGYGFGGVKS